MAAVRETFEETGLVAGAPGDVGPSSHPTWSHFRKIGQAPDLSRLGYLGCAVTPTAQPMRFHARFFFITANHRSSTINPSEELENLHWVALSDRGRSPIIQVTEFMMDTLAGRLSGEISQAPFISFNNGEPQTMWQ